jgi:hypothetical protein
MFTRSMKPALLTAASALGLLLVLGSATAQTRTSGERPHRAHVPQGSWSSHSERQRTENGHETHTTWNGQNGKTATRDAKVVNDKAAGSRTRDVSYTGPNGKQNSVHDVTQKTDNGHTRDSTYTNGKGETATRNAVVTNDKDNGTRTRDVTYTGVNGKTSTVDSVTTRTDTGYTRNATATGANGQSGTRQVTVACDKAAGNCSKDVVVNGGANTGSN